MRLVERGAGPNRVWSMNAFYCGKNRLDVRLYIMRPQENVFLSKQYMP